MNSVQKQSRVAIGELQALTNSGSFQFCWISLLARNRFGVIINSVEGLVMYTNIMVPALISMILIGTSNFALAYEKEGSVITKKGAGGTVAAEVSTPNSNERTAAPGGGLPAEAATASPAAAERAIAGKTGKTKRTAEIAGNADESPQAYTSGGGVQNPGGIQTCHVRGFKDPSGLIHEDHYQKCGTIINGMTSQCYADGRCRISY